ncbi:hypothetical protein ISI31_000663 [Salmonella enterica]|nr:hypothetical protein [Salmonella enterica]EBO9451430.1 hypothetical protein [Salmonella enterica]EBQ7118309.1 hypothetical protein [Salmonella enterica]EBT4615314.1 hypothetical protein [Salmonella enterica]EDJ0353786.1 hypothetical protein [Salmonella enterica]
METIFPGFMELIDNYTNLWSSKDWCSLIIIILFVYTAFINWFCKLKEIKSKKRRARIITEKTKVLEKLVSGIDENTTRDELITIIAVIISEFPDECD